MKKNQSSTVFKQEISSGWQFRDALNDIWRPAAVPGCVHTDLLAECLIPDPCVGTNEHDIQWVGETDWVYQTHFVCTPELLEHENLELVFNGLDTYAKVYVNDSLLLSADNMFRQWRADATPMLKPGENKITLFFRNVFDETIPKYNAAPFELQALPNNDQGEPRVAMYSRKAQFHYGWDWGPRLVTCGIWKPIVLEAWDLFRITQVQIRQPETGPKEAIIATDLEIESTCDQTVAITITADTVTLCSVKQQLKRGRNAITLEGALRRPRLWWSNGLGAPYLYQYTAVVASEGGSRTDTYQSELGVRSLQIVREKDASGTSMYVLLNGVPVFMKGANYIPLDNFQNRVTHHRHELIVKSAAEANMNMLRVWGGGIFEDDSFYDLCDKYGILIWQDMLFACAMYPGDEAFLSSVKQEVIDNIRRIRNHASIALYCGNNENEAGWEQWGWKEQYSACERAAAESNLKKLYYETIPEALTIADSTRYYHPTSPSAGFESQGPEDGDIHYWGVWHGKEPFEQYEAHIARFVSEYGFQSYPELASIEKFSESEDREFDSTVMLSHQRCMADNRRDKRYGHRLIQTYMDRYFRKPKDFSSFLYVSQILQSLGVQTAAESHRRAMPYCMGSLYWQLNDCWPVASWSSIDYYGKWKALHYAAKKFFAPVLIAPKIEEDSVKFHIVSDEPESVWGDVSIVLREFSGKILFVTTYPVTMRANTSRVCATLPKHELLGTADERRVVLVSRFTTLAGLKAENFSYFVPPKDLELEVPAYTITSKPMKNGFELSIFSSTLAKHVHLTCPDVDGFFSDNYFDLLPNEIKTLTFATDQKNIREIERKIRVVSLIDSY
ncbi:MAG TPA: glycoside hydrolase family 2 protein [Bacteroidota bacterium]|nr:glycoside hydrolase family 2 protein [Bacteroidota bacterium]